MFEHEIAVALAAGDIEKAEGYLVRARAVHPDDAGLLMWAAVIAQMTWRESSALNDLRQILRGEDREVMSQDELMARIGELSFRLGAYAECIAYLQSGSEGDGSGRRAALARLARNLPYTRAEPRELAAELPLLGGALPEMLCSFGELKHPFVLDTGASMTTVSRRFARELGVLSIIPAGTAKDGVGSEFEVSFGVAQRMSLGNFELGAQPVLVVEDGQLGLRDEFGGPERSPGGVVGLDILARFRVTFDPGRQSVLFELPRGLGARESVMCVQHDGRCLVPLTIEGKAFWFVLDTGASHSSLTEKGLYLLPSGAHRAVEQLRRVRSPSGSRYSVRGVEGLTLEVSGVEFLGVDLPVVRRPFSSRFPVHGVLGADLLMRCRTTFDMGRLRLELLKEG